MLDMEGNYGNGMGELHGELHGWPRQDKAAYFSFHPSLLQDRMAGPSANKKRKKRRKKKGRPPPPRAIRPPPATPQRQHLRSFSPILSGSCRLLSQKSHTASALSHYPPRICRHVSGRRVHIIGQFVIDRRVQGGKARQGTPPQANYRTTSSPTFLFPLSLSRCTNSPLPIP